MIYRFTSISDAALRPVHSNTHPSAQAMPRGCQANTRLPSWPHDGRQIRPALHLLIDWRREKGSSRTRWSMSTPAAIRPIDSGAPAPTPRPMSGAGCRSPPACRRAWSTGHGVRRRSNSGTPALSLARPIQSRSSSTKRAANTRLPPMRGSAPA